MWERHLKMCPICADYVAFGDADDAEADIDIHIYVEHTEKEKEEQQKEEEMEQEQACEECRLNANNIFIMGNQLIHTCPPYRF